MALSKRVCEELRLELLRLQEERKKLDDHVNGIQAVLDMVSNGGDGRATRRGVGSSRARGSNKGATLGSAILDILRSTSAPTDARVVTRQLDQLGFLVGGVTPLGRRVSHEIALLRKRGLVRRHGKTKYSVLPGPGHAVADTQVPSRAGETSGSVASPAGTME